MSAGSSHPRPVKLTPSSPESPLSTIPLPEDWDINQYASHRVSGYKSLHPKLPEVDEAEFLLLIETVKEKSNLYLVKPLELASQSELNINTFVSEVLKELPHFARYEDAWPIKAVAAKFLIFSRLNYLAQQSRINKRSRSPSVSLQNEERCSRQRCPVRSRAEKMPKETTGSKGNNTRRRSNPRKRKRNTVKYLGKKPTPATLVQLQTEYNTRHIREALRARQGAPRPKPLTTRLTRRRLSTISLTSSEDEDIKINVKKPRLPTHSAKTEPFSNLTNISQPANPNSDSSSSIPTPSTRKYTQSSPCIKCKHIEPCPPERRKRLTNAFPEEGLGQVLQELGVMNDDDLNLLLRYSEEDRKELLEKEGFSRFRTFQIEKRLQRLTPIDGDVISEGVTVDERTPRTTQTSSSSLSSIASSSKTLLEDLPVPDTTHAQCTHCGYKEPEMHIICPTIRDFLTSAGLSKLLPAFVEMEVFNDSHFKELCEWTEADRSDLFRNPGTIHLTRFQQFALKMAFRYRND